LVWPCYFCLQLKINTAPQSLFLSMIRKSVERFSLATNAERVCAEIMLNQRTAATK